MNTIEFRLSLLFLLFLSNSAMSTPLRHMSGTSLCAEGEAIILSFKLSSKDKYASLCKGAAESYLVYRFGTPAKTELQYPETLDNNSWNKFCFFGYSRGGGIENDAMGDYSISFINQNTKYIISQSWRLIDDDYFIGILIDAPGQRYILRGTQQSQSGSLVIFEGISKYEANGICEDN